jgi:glycosyltransferase involved in cell wall biosynthesis
MISVITPSYNQGKYIERTLLSVLSQKGADFEYIVMDGGSSDETPDILKKYKEKYQDKLQWISERDTGQANAVNKGIAGSTGDILGWLNSDDIYYPGVLQRVSAFFDAHPGVDIVYGNADFIDETDRFLGHYPTGAWNADRLCDVCFLCQPAVFFRRRVIEKHGLLDENLMYCMDYEYWLRLARGKAYFVYSQHTLAGSRVYPETKTVAMRIAAHEEMLSMLVQRLGRAPDGWVVGYSHVMAEEKGLDPAHSPVRFVLSVMMTTWQTAIRFNKKISWGVIQAFILWFLNGVRFAHQHILR